MDINDINFALQNCVLLKTTKQVNEWQIQTSAKFENGASIDVFLINEGNKWYISDKKNTLKYMNNMYDLKAVDVKNCIMAILRIYGFGITAGSIVAEIKETNQIEKVFFDFIMCIGQLANMYAFFDKP